VQTSNIIVARLVNAERRIGQRRSPSASDSSLGRAPRGVGHNAPIERFFVRQQAEGSLTGRS
jgi:hypothetical protein